MSHYILLGRKPNTDGWNYIATVENVDSHKDVIEAAVEKASGSGGYEPPEARSRIEWWEEKKAVKLAEEEDGDIKEYHTVDL